MASGGLALARRVRRAIIRAIAIGGALPAAVPTTVPIAGGVACVVWGGVARIRRVCRIGFLAAAGRGRNRHR